MTPLSGLDGLSPGHARAMFLKRSGVMSMNCSKELERRKGMSSEEFVGRLKNLLHQVRMEVIRTHWRLCYSANKGRAKKTCISQ